MRAPAAQVSDAVIITHPPAFVVIMEAGSGRADPARPGSRRPGKILRKY
jgi:hypothetical protein